VKKYVFHKSNQDAIERSKNVQYNFDLFCLSEIANYIGFEELFRLQDVKDLLSYSATSESEEIVKRKWGDKRLLNLVERNYVEQIEEKFYRVTLNGMDRLDELDLI
jgi:hypothetical protein